ncbi:hypothetical protein F5877DRAFT_78487 [Lentinula edodes]|nr:hypothetical protein F5877DRAFT_78487 [Lentinula edodes]
MAINHPEWYQGLQPSVSGAATEQPFLTCKSKPHRDMESEAKAAHKQARMEQADTFRGVHLDPNAHHWNEMEEDDDHFLDGVIEFGDGRQYKADTTEGPMPSACPPEVNTREPTTSSEEHPEAVRKEDRFADNFDRSWPRTKDVSTLTSDFAHLPASRAPHNISPSTSQSAHSPVEASRVLFNERSNRLEPYNNSRELGRSTQRSDSGFVRSPASATFNVSSNNIQLLRKLAPGEGSYRVWGYNDTNEKQREHEIPRREMQPVSPHRHFAWSSFDRALPPGHRGRRLSNMEPPPVPFHATNRALRITVDNYLRIFLMVHQSLPPSSVDSPLGILGTLLGLYPVSSPITVSTESPVSTPQSAAESETTTLVGRGREEKERARRKAAEIEAGLVEEKEKAEQEKVKLCTKEAKVCAIIEEAVSSVQTKPASIPGVNGVSFEKSPLRRLSTTRMPPQDASRPPFARKSSSFALPTPATPSGTAESWKSKPSAVAPPPSSQPPSATTGKSRAMSFATPPPSALDHVESLTDLEVVDYSDLAEFMGVPEKIEEEQSKDLQVTQSETVSPSKSRRPVASDFFDEESPSFIVSSTSTVRFDAGAWETNNEVPAVISLVDENAPNDAVSQSEVAVPEVVVPVLSKQAPVDQNLVPTVPPHIPPTGARRNHYNKEAAMSAVDDAMSGIRPTCSYTLSLITHVIQSLASSSPKRVSTYRDVCNNVHRAAEVSKGSYSLQTTATIPVRWDILSLTPPVEGMSRREFTLNDVLFRKPYSYGGYKGKSKYRVQIPKSVLKVNLPSQNVTARPSTASKLTGADGASTWRKPTTTTGKIELQHSVGLDTTSRSPPPEPEPKPVSQVKKGEEVLTESEDTSVAPMHSRSQPKMPAGSGVAFYRNAHLSTESGLKSSVSLFATNELEVPSNTSLEDSQSILIAQDLHPNAVSTANTQPSPSSSSTYDPPSLIPSGKTESKSSDDSADRVPLSPPAHHTSPWARPSLGIAVKESLVRRPDPEHLKVVWSQTSNQPGLLPVNSSDGITDDLPTVPFTSQDVKSEDGQTPPPRTVASSRMSLHDVTRAFQQVPSSPSISSHRPTISPPSTTAPVARPTPTYKYHTTLAQPPNQNARPPYPYRPPPTMSHSSAPSTMFSHPSPIPNRMQVRGQPLYSPVWMPLQKPNAQSSPMSQESFPLLRAILPSIKTTLL